MVEPRAYYNEHDKYAAAWLRNLIAAGHIAPGDVDERDIRDVRPDDVRRYTQCHWFAGIGVWSHSLRRAGWPDRRPVWTWSEPCQPFSAAGRGLGAADERYLRPHMHHLVRSCRPENCFGEQVASKDGLAWLDTLQSDMEGEGYAFGALDMCAAGFGAPHIRQRLYWMAHDDDERYERGGRARRRRFRFENDSAADFLGDAYRAVTEQPARQGTRSDQAPGAGAFGQLDGSSNARGVGFTDSAGSQPGWEGRATMGHGRSADTTGGARELADAGSGGLRRGHEHREHAEEAGEVRREAREQRLRPHYSADGAALHNAPTGPVNGIWRNADWLLCRDGKWRPVRSGTFPLAHGAPARVGRLRAYGNAIVAPQAEEFIGAYLDVEHFRLSLTTGIFD